MLGNFADNLILTDGLLRRIRVLIKLRWLNIMSLLVNVVGRLLLLINRERYLMIKVSGNVTIFER